MKLKDNVNIIPEHRSILGPGWEPGGGGGGARLGFILDWMCELNFFKRPISKVFNMLKLYP